MTLLVLDRKIQGNLEIRIRDKKENKSTTLTLLSETDNIHSLRLKIKEWIENERATMD